MVDVPRRLQQSGAEKVAVIADRAAPGSHRGVTQWSKPSRIKTPTPQQGTTAGGDMPRLAVGYRTAAPGSLAANDNFYIDDWTFFDEDASGGAIVADANGITIFEEGIYAVNLFLHPAGMSAASAASAIHFFCDVLEPFSTGFGCTARGGDPEFGRSLLPSTSRTYYNPGTGYAGTFSPGLVWINLDTAALTDPIVVEVQVQRIA